MRKIYDMLDDYFFVLLGLAGIALFCPELFKWLIDLTAAVFSSAYNATVSLPWPPQFFENFAGVMLRILSFAVPIVIICALYPKRKKGSRRQLGKLFADKTVYPMKIETPEPSYGPAPEILREPLDRIWKESKSFEPDRGREVLEVVCRKISELFALPYRPHSVLSPENYRIKLTGMIPLIELMKTTASRPNCASDFEATLADLQTFVAQIESDIKAADAALSAPLEIRRKMLLERSYPEITL